MSFSTPQFDIGAGLWNILLSVSRLDSNNTSGGSNAWLQSVSVAANSANTLARRETGTMVAKSASTSGGRGGRGRDSRQIKEGTLEALITEVVVSVLASAVICGLGAGVWQLSRFIAKAISGEDSHNDVDQFNSGAAARLNELLKKRGRESKPLRLSSHETHLAEDIVDPDDIGDGFKDIGGLDTLKQEIWELAILPLLRPELFRSKSKLLQQPSGILLYGKPGCGKTLLAKAIAKESSAVFIPIKLSKILNKWVGESNKLVAATFSLAQKVAPAIIFLDEVDCFLSDSVDPSASKSMESLKAEFLTLWDGVTSNGNHAPVLVLGATNRPHLIDTAILRRMPRTFGVPLPGREGREQIIRILMQDQPMDASAEGFISYMAGEPTKGYSGSDLKELCRTAAKEPIHEVVAEEARRAVMGEKPLPRKASEESEEPPVRPVSKEDFKKALSKVKRSGQVTREYGRQVAQENAAQELSMDNEQLMQIVQQFMAQYPNLAGNNRPRDDSDAVPNI